MKLALNWSAGLQPALDERKPVMNVIKPEHDANRETNAQSRSQTGAPFAAERRLAAGFGRRLDETRPVPLWAARVVWAI